MSVNDLVLVQGMHDTRLALERWNREPWKVLRPWLLLSIGIAGLLLVAVFVVATLTTPDSSRYILPGVNSDTTMSDYARAVPQLARARAPRHGVRRRLHGRQRPPPLSASHRSGIDRWVHEKARPFAIAFVLCATTFSLCTQAYLIGSGAATIAHQLGMSPGVLILSLLPHALPELVALFLPLAAWIVASRHDEWQDLLAATAVTVAVAVPTLLAAAAVEI